MGSSNSQSSRRGESDDNVACSDFIYVNNKALVLKIAVYIRFRAIMVPANAATPT